MVKRIKSGHSDSPNASSGESARRSAGAQRRSRSTTSTRRAAPVERAAAIQHASASFVTRGKDALAGDAGGIAAAVAVGVGAALIEAELLPGILLGAGAMLLGRVFPQLNEGMRPMLKSVVGASLSLADKTRGLLAEASEQVQDVVAEVKAERRQGTARKARHDERSAPSRELPGGGALPH